MAGSVLKTWAIAVRNEVVCICHTLYTIYTLNVVSIDSRLAHATWNGQVMDFLRVSNSLGRLSCAG